MIIAATIMAFIAVYLMQDNAKLTKKRIKIITSSLLFMLSITLFCLAYGTLKGIFIFLGLISLLGTLLTWSLHHELMRFYKPGERN